MIPVVPQTEPDVFDELVRNKGIKFLSKFTTSKPTTKQWNEHDYWKYVRKQLYSAYNGICAYSAHWIPLTTNPNIDHYIPKSINPNLAYEWNNYRLACALVNTLKKDYQDVLDPFLIKKDWFILDFPSLLVKANSILSDQKLQEVRVTIERLKLNDDKFVNDRDEWLKRYCLGEATFSLLKKVAPFIAYELERQGLIEEIKRMMDYIPDSL